MVKDMKTSLTIAGSDPSCGAGLQSDILTFAAFGVTPLSAVAALTAQDYSGVSGTFAPPSAFLKKQIETLIKSFRIDAVKVGMLGSADNVNVLIKLLRDKKLKNVVLDPVIASSGGYPLIDKRGVAAYKRLLPLSTVFTPNIPEASLLLGTVIETVTDMEDAARLFHRIGAKFVLIKGGHMASSPVDVFFDGRRFTRFKGTRIKGRKERFHGTGCMLSAAIAASIANGVKVDAAIRVARAYVRKIILARK